MITFFLFLPSNFSLAFIWNKRRGKFSSKIDITILRLWTLILIDSRMFWREVDAIIFIAFSYRGPRIKRSMPKRLKKIITENCLKPLMIGHYENWNRCFFVLRFWVGLWSNWNFCGYLLLNCFRSFLFRNCKNCLHQKYFKESFKDSLKNSNQAKSYKTLQVT